MKKYNISHNVGAAKYLVTHYDGKKTYEDGSESFDIRIFSNQKKMQSFIKDLIHLGYIDVQDMADIIYLTEAHNAYSLAIEKDCTRYDTLIPLFIKTALHIDTNWIEPMTVIRFKDGSKLVELNGILTAFYN